MRRALKLVLVLAALLGMFGQTVAVGANPTMAAVGIMAPAVMPVDCLGMMQGGDSNSMPCARMTLACISCMGCAIPFTLDSGQLVIAEAMIWVAAPAWPVTPALDGRSIQPDPHPPRTLA